MKTLLAILTLCAAVSLADEIKRDANGNVIERDQSTATGVIVRDANGNIVGRKEVQANANGSKTVIVRDANGNVIERNTRQK